MASRASGHGTVRPSRMLILLISSFRGATSRESVLKRFAGKALVTGLVVGLAGSWPAAGAARPVREPGVGSSLSAWKTAYGSGSHCNPSLCFGPFIDNTADGRVHEFVAVQATGSRRVNSYDRAFPSNTSSSEAMLMILNTFPPNVKATAITVARTKTGSDTCGDFNLTSPTIGKELRKDDPTGVIGVEFWDGSEGYSATNVQDALVTDTANTPGTC
jgi:hypothetical protein